MRPSAAPRMSLVVVGTLVAAALAGCSRGDRGEASDTAGESAAAEASSDSTPAAQPSAAAPSSGSAEPAVLTTADIDRYERALQAQLQAVRDARRKLGEAKNATDSASAMLGASDIGTQEIAMRAWGADPNNTDSSNRYKTMRGKLDEMVSAMAPDTASWAKEMRDAMRQSHVEARTRALADVPADVVTAVEARLARLSSLKREILTEIGRMLR